MGFELSLVVVSYDVVRECYGVCEFAKFCRFKVRDAGI